jgi:hypothetical protein
MLTQASNVDQRRKIEADIAEALRLLHPSADVWEVRSPHTRQGTISGYYNDPQRCARDVTAQLDGKVPCIYVTLNPSSRSSAHGRIRGCKPVPIQRRLTER